MNRQKLTKKQREVLVGILLGDAHLERPYRIVIEQGDKHKAYIEHLLGVFANFVGASPPRKREVRLGEKIHINWCFQTRHHVSFLFYAQQFYHPRKRVPPIIHRLLTPRAIAYWYMDDGSIKSKQSKGVIFNTQGFCYKDVCTLCDVLAKKFQLKCWPRKQKEGYQIYVSGDSYERLRELIYPYLIPEMAYKFPVPRIRGLRSTELPKE